MAKRSANVEHSLSKAVGRFNFFTKDDDSEYMLKVYRPKNTEPSTSRAVKTFQTWMSCHNAGKEKSTALQICCLPMIKPAFRTDLHNLLRRLDARMESHIPTKNNPHAYGMSLHLCKVSTFCGNVCSYVQLQMCILDRYLETHETQGLSSIHGSRSLVKAEDVLDQVHYLDHIIENQP